MFKIGLCTSSKRGLSTYSKLQTSGLVLYDLQTCPTNPSNLSYKSMELALQVLGLCPTSSWQLSFVSYKAGLVLRASALSYKASELVLQNIRTCPKRPPGLPYENVLCLWICSMDLFYKKFGIVLQVSGLDFSKSVSNLFKKGLWTFPKRPINFFQTPVLRTCSTNLWNLLFKCLDLSYKSLELVLQVLETCSTSP